MKTIVVIGATGDVGQGIVAELLQAGHAVTAVGRSPDRLARLTQIHAGIAALSTLRGSVETLDNAKSLAAAIGGSPAPDAIVVSVNGRQQTSGVFDLQADTLEQMLRSNLSTHLVAAQALIPAVAPGGLYLGIGGGMADLVFPGNAAISMAQAAQRALFRYLAKEGEGRPVMIRELLLYAMIAGERTRATAEPHWLTAEEVGRHVAAIIADPGPFEGPILSLKSRKQVGQPERKPT